MQKCKTQSTILKNTKRLNLALLYLANLKNLECVYGCLPISQEIHNRQGSQWTRLVTLRCSYVWSLYSFIKDMKFFVVKDSYYFSNDFGYSLWSLGWNYLRLSSSRSALDKIMLSASTDLRRTFSWENIAETGSRLWITAFCLLVNLAFSWEMALRWDVIAGY